MTNKILNNRNYDEHISNLEYMIKNLKNNDIQELKLMINDLSNRFFKDNGKPSIQTTMYNHEMRLFCCENEIKSHKESHKESALLIKKPLVSIVLTSIISSIVSFFTLFFTKFKG